MRLRFHEPSAPGLVSVLGLLGAGEADSSFSGRERLAADPDGVLFDCTPFVVVAGAGG